MLNQQRNIGIKGEYKFVKRNKYNEEITLCSFSNLLTDTGIDRLINTEEILAGAIYCQLGTGVTEPQVSDISLGSYSVHTSIHSDKDYPITDVSPIYFKTTRVFTFEPGQATGTFTEVGVGWSTNTNLLSKSLIKDSNGTAISLTIAADEYLDIHYSFYWYFPDNPITSVLNINSVDTDLTVKLYNCNSELDRLQTFKNLRYPKFLKRTSAVESVLTSDIFNDTLSNKLDYPETGYLPLANVQNTFDSYVAGSFELIIESVFNQDYNFINGVNTFVLHNKTIIGDNIISDGGWQIGYNPAIVKSSEQQFKLRTKIQFSRI